MFACNPEYEQLRELGRQIMQADPSKSAAVQNKLSKVNESWDGVQALLGDKLQHYSGVANAWQQYNDLKQGVVKTLDDVAPLANADITFSSQPEVKKALDQHKVSLATYTYYIKLSLHIEIIYRPAVFANM